MLNVQVQYAQHLENQRHNVEMERLQERNQHEVERHNVVLEHQGFQNLQEVSRHNLITESQQSRQIAINQGHLELGRATLEENARHNLIAEQNAAKQANASIMQAQAALNNARTNAQRMVAQNSLDAATEHLRNVQALESHAQQSLLESSKRNQEQQSRYYQVQADYYDTQLIMRMMQQVGGAIMPFVTGGK